MSRQYCAKQHEGYEGGDQYQRDGASVVHRMLSWLSRLRFRQPGFGPRLGICDSFIIQLPNLFVSLLLLFDLFSLFLDILVLFFFCFSVVNSPVAHPTNYN